MMPAGARRSAVELAAVLTAAVLVVVGCGDATSGDAPRAEAHPFAVDPAAVPERYELVALGRGTDEPVWSSETGSDETLTVVEVDGRAVHASIVDWEPMESELKWASRSGDREPEVFTLVDGRPAAFGEGHDGAWDDLVIEVGDTEALMIAAQDATRDELVAMVDHVVTDGDRTVAPVVRNAPEGWRVIGSVGMDAAVARSAEVRRRSNEVPGPASSFAMGWVDTLPVDHEGPPGSLSVMVLPGDSADLAALRAAAARRSGEQPEDPEPVEVDGRQGAIVGSSVPFGGGGGVVTLFLESGTGALVVVTATGSRVLSTEELLALGASVHEIDPEQWEAERAATFGGPQLVADDGESEIARGEVDGIEWLLQTSSTARPEGAVGFIGPDSTGLLPPVAVQVDECLKLSTRQRACAGPSIGGAGGSLWVWNDTLPQADGVEFPEFLIVVTPVTSAERVRISAGPEAIEGALSEVPGGMWEQARAGVVVGSLPGGTPIPTCHPAPPDAPAGSDIYAFRIDLLDASGAEVGCVGM